MSSKELLLGIDVGTTGSKALLVDDEGGVLAEELVEYPMFTPHPLWAEQNPAHWWNATIQAIRGVLDCAGVTGSSICCVGLAGQMHGLVLIDSKGDVLRPCIMWNDQRTVKQCEDVMKMLGEDGVLGLVGNPMLPGFTAPKIAWVRQHEPELYARIDKVLLPKDYVRYRLTGGCVSDVADASGTALFDVRNRRWSDDMLAAFEVPRDWLCDVTESIETSSEISAEAFEATGLAAGTPVVGGAGDQAAGAISAGIVDEGGVSVMLGTSGVVFAASKSYRVEPKGRLHAFCHAVPGMWHLMGVMLSAGGSLRWYRDALCHQEKAAARDLGIDTYELLTEAARKVPAGCEDLLFLPYLSGERTPYADPHARGVFFGLTLRHQKEHMTRAVMEGVAYGLRDSLELMRSLGVKIDEVRMLGGGAKSLLWRQILADVFSTRIISNVVTQGAAYGAALLAGVGAGAFEDVNDACAKAGSQAVDHGCVETEPGNGKEIYATAYPRYQSLYKALKDEFTRA